MTSIHPSQEKGMKENDFLRPMKADIFRRVQLVHEGLPANILDQAAAALEVPKATLFDALNLPISTMTRRAAAGFLLSLDESDKVDRLAQVFKEAINVFGDEVKAGEWMTTRIPALGDRQPARSPMVHLPDT